jgi:thiamine-monophosphate kinase
VSEESRIAKLVAILGTTPGSESITLGIGDDAAVIDRTLVWTIDTQIEGTHFRRAWLSWEDVGYRSVMAAASDLAAMGAEPIAALASLALAPAIDDDAFEAIARGQAEAARAIGAPIVGGNLARATETSLTTTWIGRAEKPIRRSTARPGDGLYVAGPLGLAATGLAALEASLAGPALDEAIRAWRRPRARIADGLAMRDHATSAVDVSDGLSRDAAHLATASGVCVVLDEALLRAHAGALEVERVLHGGEDYALLVTSPTPIGGFSSIGSIEEGSGVVLATATGRVPLPSGGFEHF